MTTQTIIDEDLCAECAHCCLLRPFGRFPSKAPALCVRGWPPRKLFHNIVSQCASFEKDPKKATP